CAGEVQFFPAVQLQLRWRTAVALAITGALAVAVTEMAVAKASSSSPSTPALLPASGATLHTLSTAVNTELGTMLSTCGTRSWSSSSKAVPHQPRPGTAKPSREMALAAPGSAQQPRGRKAHAASRGRGAWRVDTCARARPMVSNGASSLSRPAASSSLAAVALPASASSVVPPVAEGGRGAGDRESRLSKRRLKNDMAMFQFNRLKLLQWPVLGVLLQELRPPLLIIGVCYFYEV
ncbi:hypothetical protein CYMTET_50183, partial [Cymbomonas tetramitiformis]